MILRMLMNVLGEEKFLDGIKVLSDSSLFCCGCNESDQIFKFNFCLSSSDYERKFHEKGIFTIEPRTLNNSLPATK